ncbi:palmitoyltransferase akr1 [Tulasnella sp. 425]|nr:palmitoyltransferase akr1 [Tulasnella sp. 425]
MSSHWNDIPADGKGNNGPGGLGLAPKAAAATSSVNTQNVSGTGANSAPANPTATVVHDEAPNVFLAAQRGDVDALRQLIESGRAKATDRDDQNVTPLHWAAINAQLPACKYLLEQGAEVDALGGDLLATPMQWAARNGYLYIIDVLISYNADPSIVDSQGYNTLHLVTHSSTVMPLLYLLHLCPISPDSPDSAGHTALMWAAYQGDGISVEILLNAGASPLKKDNSGLTPLHWAVVRGNKWCIRKLIEAGSDLNARDESGKTPREMAAELKSLGPWRKALEEGGLTEDGRKIQGPLSERNTKFAILILPTVFFYIIFSTFAAMPWFTGIPLAAAEFFAMHHISTRVLLSGKSYTENVTSSPYFAAIIGASMFWVGEAWVARLMPITQGHAFAHLFYAIMWMLCAYNFFRAVTLDPGTCPKPANEQELKLILQDLTTQGRLNGQTFCVSCMARKPLRSKHCRVCDRCIARHDHHCPWVWNCVGANNHRQFLLFVITLVLGIISFDYLTVAYFSTPAPTPPRSAEPPMLSTSPPEPSEDDLASCLLPDPLCSAVRRDAFLFSVAAWSTLQLTWTVVLLASQLWQIARQMTTLEVSNLGRYGFMGGRGGSSMVGQQGHQHLSGDAGDEISSAHHHAHGHKKATGFLLSVLGFDRFTKGKAADGLKKAAHAPNPFDLGWIGNCKDFWTKGKELGVEYEMLYDVPPEGFREAKRRRAREEAEDGFSSGYKRNSGMFARTMMMGRNLTGLGGGRSRGYGGYEPVSSGAGDV